MVSSVALLWLAGCGGGSDPLVDMADRDRALRCDDDDSSSEEPPAGPVCEEGSRGELVSVQFVASYPSKKKLEKYWDSWLNGFMALGYIDDTVEPGIENGVDTFVVEYCTVDFDGSPILASGMLASPRTFWTAPTVVYSHGTSVTRVDTPSNPNVDEVFDGPTPMVVFAGAGYLYLAPDLTGFGSSEAPRHRYFHAETEAASTLDLVRAMESWWPYTLKADGRLFNMGFSQGGHTALAFAEAAEAEGYTFEATAVVGAVGDPEAWFDWLLDQVDNSYLQLYTGDLSVSYDDVYDLYADPAEAYVAPYDTTIDGLYDMSLLFADVALALPGSAAELMTPEFYAAAQDPAADFRTHLAENRVDDLCSSAPIRMYHSVDDGEVPYDLGVASADALATCNDVELVDWFGLDHLNTWHEVLPAARDWFDTF